MSKPFETAQVTPNPAVAAELSGVGADRSGISYPEACLAAGAAAVVLLVGATANMARGSKPKPEEIAASDEALKKLSASEIREGGQGQGRAPSDEEARGTAEALGMSVKDVNEQGGWFW